MLLPEAKHYCLLKHEITVYCHTGRFEIVVLLPNTNLIQYPYYIMTRLVETFNVKSENKVETCSYPGFVVQIMFACLILICLFVYLLEGLALKLIYCLLILLFLFCLFCLFLWFIFCLYDCLFNAFYSIFVCFACLFLFVLLVFCFCFLRLFHVLICD